MDARQQTLVEAFRPMAERWGWRVDHESLNTRERVFGLHVAVTQVSGYAPFSLRGPWRGVPVVAQQLWCRMEHAYVAKTYTTTVVVVPRAQPGAACSVVNRRDWLDPRGRDRKVEHPGFAQRFAVYSTRQKHATETLVPPLVELLAADPRMNNRALFIERDDITVLSNSEIRDEQSLRDSADLAVDVAAALSGMAGAPAPVASVAVRPDAGPPPATGPAEVAQQWLDGVHGGRVGLVDGRPIMENPQTWTFGCASYTPDGWPESGVMLAAAVAVPKDGSPPFHPTNADPWTDLQTLPPRPAEQQVWRTNALGCAVVGDLTLGGARAAASPWTPADEAPGWWDRMVAQNFPDAQVTVCTDWDGVIRPVRDGGLGTRGVVWLRRQVNGVEFTGHLINVVHGPDGVAFLDFQTGGLANLERPENVKQLVLASFRRPPTGR